VEPHLVLTLDAGGSGVKAAVVSARDGSVAGSARRDYSPQYPAPGLVEFDPDAWWTEIAAAGAAAAEHADRPSDEYLAVTCTAMRIPFVLLDAERRPVGPGVLNIDTRGEQYLDEVRSALGPERLYELTGHWAGPKFGLPKLLWFARGRPELWRRVRHVLQLHDWLCLRLSGELVGEPSSVSMAQLLDVTRRTWATELLDALELDAGLLPPLREAGEWLGGLTAEAAEALRLAEGTAVHVGGGDTHVVCLGAGAARDGDVTIVAGSTAPIHLTATEPLLDQEHEPLVSAHLRPGLWAMETNAGTTGLMYGWLREVGCRDYAALDELAAAAPPGARGLMVTAPNPRWGEASWSRTPPVALLGLTPGHSLGDVARATLESICHAVKGNLESLEGARGGPVDRVYLTGGASRSSFFAQLTADVLNREVYVPAVESPAARAGMLLVTGNEATLEPEATVYSPDAERSDAYQPLGERYRDAFERLREPVAV
jgi:xylulokinase